MNTSINDKSINGEPRERGEARERNLTTADLAASAEQRSALEGEFNQADRSSTENLRLALRRYRSFFERLLVI